MEETITVQVPAAEAEELEALIRDMAVDTEPIDSRAFDGGMWITAVLTFTTTTLPVLKVWLQTRSQERRSTKVTIKGKQFQGYRADEVVAMLEAAKDTNSTEDEGKESKGKSKKGKDKTGK